MKTQSKSPRTLIEAVQYFADPEVALNFFVPIRWPKGVTCPHCGSDKVSFLAHQRRWQCHTKHAKRQFSAKVGTIMEDSPLSLEKWLVAIWLETNAKNSISSYEVSRALGITQKSAWFMLHRIRLALKTGSFDKKMGGDKGVVEADETFVGGLSKNMHKSRRVGMKPGGAGKVGVMGLLERHSGDKPSQVRAQVIENTKRETLQSIIRSNVEKGSHVYTDAWQAYRYMGRDYFHMFVDHAERYTFGVVHTNGIENFWALLKRCIKGTHVSVEPFHLGAYIDSEAFRFNHREETDGTRFVRALNGVSGKRLTYKSLIGNEMPLEGRMANDKGEEKGLFV